MGMFDDLIPQGQQPGPKPGGMFADLIPAAPQQTGPMSWSDVGSQALSNAPGSAVQFAKNMVQPILHPIETAENIGKVGSGLAGQLGVQMGGPDPEADQAWDQFKGFFKDRYGSVEGFKKALATDPVGVLGDASMVLSGGETALARAPGIVGKVGEVAGAAGRALDPLSAVAKPAAALLPHAQGWTTGMGSAPFKTAMEAGREGGDAASAFRAHMTGAAPMEEAVSDARAALGQLRKERGDLYQKGMAGVGADKTILSWNDVDTALADMDRVAVYKGQSLSPSTEAIRNKITSTIDEWKNLQASEFWTPEGFDALKKKVGDLRDATQFGTPERRVADQAYQAIRKTIVDQAPEYAGVMKGYEEASKQLQEIERTLSLKPGASIDTALRKLQSTLRNNVNTNYGKRTELANFLVSSGATNLLHKLAGQALSTWQPRGIARGVVAGADLPAIGAALASGHIGAAAGAAASLPLMSPRLMGEAAYGAGKVQRHKEPITMVPRVSRQIGQTINPNGDQQ